MPDTSLQAINSKAIALRAQGRLREAVAAFSEGIVAHPNEVVLYNNLATTLDDLGSTDEALLAYDSALARAPKLIEALVGKARLLLRIGRIDEARETFERALAADPSSVAAHLGMYELLQIQGDLPGAVDHQRAALARQRLFSAPAPFEQRSVVVLCAPGDWQANVPVDFLFDRNATTVHKLFLTDDDTAAQVDRVPEADVVFNAIAESDEATEYLARARTFIDAAGIPYLNAPEAVKRLGRRALPDTLAAVNCTVVASTDVDRTQLERGESPVDFPIIVRPVGSHAGHDLARVASRDELAAYLNAVSATDFFVSPFVDYSSPEGLYRKYRVVFVDGTPYPVHLAISPNWMIHYYNAPMDEHQWMRDEEELFLSDLDSAFEGAPKAALDELARVAGLEYFGIDCSIGRDGRLLVFEADTAMLVHASDPIELYPYKHRYVPRIFRAIEEMIDRRKFADT